MIYLLVEFFCFVCHDMVSYYEITLTSLFINCYATSDFCLCGMHNTSYDTPIVTSLTQKICEPFFFIRTCTHYLLFCLWTYLSILLKRKAVSGVTLLILVLPSHQTRYYSRLPSYRFVLIFSSLLLFSDAREEADSLPAKEAEPRCGLGRDG
jgi:hypothetical protein